MQRSRFSGLSDMAFTPSGTLIIYDRDNDRLRRVDLNNGHVTVIEHIFGCCPSGVVAHSSGGTSYVAAEHGLCEIRSADGVVSRLAQSSGHRRDQGKAERSERPATMVCSVAPPPPPPPPPHGPGQGPGPDHRPDYGPECGY